MKIKKIKKRISYLLGRTIIQFSPLRSGSTLVYNILRDIFPYRYVKKQHHCRSGDLKFPMVVTYRHPLDCIASSIQCYGLRPTNEVLEKHISKYENKGFQDLIKLKNERDILFLRYEDFRYDFETIFRGFEIFFNIYISPKRRRFITDRYRIEAVERVVKNKKKFSEYDPITHWHGRHISKYRGKIYYYKEFFQDSQIEYLTSKYKSFLVDFGYMSKQ